MLKRIRTDQVELGMFIHRLEGNWFRHPFWKARFVLNDPARLQSLRNSAVEWVVIDIARGRDGGDEPAPLAARPPPAGISPASAVTVGMVPPGRRAVELSPEIARAERLARFAGKAVNRMFLEARLGKRIAASDVAPVVDEIYASVQRNIYAFSGLLRCQSDQLHLYRHALAVCALMVALARSMQLSADATREAGMVGMLMDTALAQLSAEAGVADYRNLPDDLAKGHVLLGQTQFRAAGDIPPNVLTGCLQHHERLDGSGYPRGLSGPAIGELARMAAVCDDFVNLVSGPALDPASALGVIMGHVALYDPVIVERLVEAVGIYPIGSFVRLRSGRLAMVVDQDPTDSALPVLRIFAATGLDGLEPLRPTTLALGECYGEDAIEGIVDPVGLRLPPIDGLREDLMTGAIRSSTRSSPGTPQNQKKG
jgi:HD-GYP domain-containing protein (c-di-GMP phosphodiesterase class II)